MAVTITQVTSKRDLKKFIMFPFSLYKGNDCWVPPLLFDEYNTLRKDKNPAFEDAEAEYWLAWKDGKLAGRIAGIIVHKAIKKWGQKNARFGWVDFIDDREVSKALFDTVEAWARSKGMEGIQGPMGFTDLDKEGMLIEGFNELGTLPMIYNHAYYKDHLEALGYVKDVDWLEFEVLAPKEIPEKVRRVNELILKRSNLHLAQAKSAHQVAKKYAHQIFEIIDEAYEHLYGTVPLTEKQVDAYIKQYLSFINLRYTKIIVDDHDRVVGFGIAMPSLSRALQKAQGRLFPFGWIHILKALKNPKIIDLYLVAVRKAYLNRGLNALLLAEVTKNAIEDGVEKAETAGELETNTAVLSMWDAYEKRQHKRRRAYIKKLV